MYQVHFAELRAKLTDGTSKRVAVHRKGRARNFPARLISLSPLNSEER